MKEDVVMSKPKKHVGLYGSGLFDFGCPPNLVRMLFVF